MTNKDIDLNGISLNICEVEGILDVLIFIQSEADPAQRLRLTDAVLTLLHLAGERLGKASEKVEGLAAAA
ncbi:MULTISPECIES: hypothetical protein [unclassified Mesorhizobium]|uniref:hypothetical protein n=1 Tax=unclassified Mesorhizobium TaxID=325217 RepID=UPI000FCC1C39|nr:MULTISPECIES: hypothetical protein [unclassified Mesorhizobium]RUV59832.1 hypothetical protein EOA85_10765 [Mesorhizobium sp. M5C.F.Ca.IN.020.29.1.1]TIM56010.1 MAG: hypothetical protein E5Y46_15425 [Mesorhizobium sp.]TIM86933.1 MAG: hypothetical protein E5Y50_13815 [Mesorhizobium sp.]TIR28875.1 MAG: hypothetical protein E5X35_28905 [Mesorhizobium sp.]TIS20455.1 MAG: hypothetical protein E5X07_25395 [Mesorhizobium sp.]